MQNIKTQTDRYDYDDSVNRVSYTGVYNAKNLDQLEQYFSNFAALCV